MIEFVNQLINFFLTFLSLAIVFETRLTACDTADSMILNCSPIFLRCTDVYLCHKYCLTSLDSLPSENILSTASKISSMETSSVNAFVAGISLSVTFIFTKTF